MSTKDTGFAQGGPISPPDTDKKETVLDTGEFRVSKSALEHYGKETLQAIYPGSCLMKMDAFTQEFPFPFGTHVRMKQWLNIDGTILGYSIEEGKSPQAKIRYVHNGNVQTLWLNISEIEASPA